MLSSVREQNYAKVSHVPSQGYANAGSGHRTPGPRRGKPTSATPLPLVGRIQLELPRKALLRSGFAEPYSSKTASCVDLKERHMGIGAARYLGNGLVRYNLWLILFVCMNERSGREMWKQRWKVEVNG